MLADMLASPPTRRMSALCLQNASVCISTLFHSENDAEMLRQHLLKCFGCFLDVQFFPTSLSQLCTLAFSCICKKSPGKNEGESRIITGLTGYVPRHAEYSRRRMSENPKRVLVLRWWLETSFHAWKTIHLLRFCIQIIPFSIQIIPFYIQIVLSQPRMQPGATGKQQPKLQKPF